MFHLFEKTKNFSPVAVQVTQNGTIAGLILAVIIREYSGPLGFFSSRTVIYGGPLISQDSDNREEIFDLLIKELIRKVEKRTIFIQFRNFYDRQEMKEIFEAHGFKYLERINYLVDTTSGGRWSGKG